MKEHVWIVEYRKSMGWAIVEPFFFTRQQARKATGLYKCYNYAVRVRKINIQKEHDHKAQWSQVEIL